MQHIAVSIGIKFAEYLCPNFHAGHDLKEIY